jgi:SAM-dependent methyltransferase
MRDEIDPQLELMFSFYERLQRLGPGSEASTRRALSFIAGLPSNPRIVEFGCGAGAATMILASADAHVTAVDIHQPFLDALGSQARRLGVDHKITTLEADMADPPLPDGTFDVVWSEGAAYIMGFEAAMRRWRRLLRPEGHIAVSEIAWITDSRPSELSEFWANAYPAIASIEQNQATLRSTGYDPIAHFVLPSEDWSETYYAPLRPQLALFREERRANSAAQAFADELDQELELWTKYHEYYSYVFYVAKAV